MIYLLYFLIILFSNTLGATAGIGGGIIIKPALDFLGYHDLPSIAFYSSIAVFTMSTSAIFSRISNRTRRQNDALAFFIFGALMGGYTGNSLFERLMEVTANEQAVRFVQGLLTIFLLTLVLIHLLKGYPSIQKQSKLAYFMCSFALGTISSLLGIGGGPINISLCIFILGISIKRATLLSIICIFFSQITNLGILAIYPGFTSFDLHFLLVIIPAALLGGFLGSKINDRITEKRLQQLFLAVLIFVMLLNLYNASSYFFS